MCRSYLRTTEHDAKAVATLVDEAKSLLKRADKKASKDPEAALELYEDAAYRFMAAATSPLQDQVGQMALREALGQIRAVNDDVQKLGVRAAAPHAPFATLAVCCWCSHLTARCLLCVKPGLQRGKGARAPGAASTQQRHQKLSQQLQKLGGISKQLGGA